MVSSTRRMRNPLTLATIGPSIPRQWASQVMDRYARMAAIWPVTGFHLIGTGGEVAGHVRCHWTADCDRAQTQ